jgi:predicted esterase YcpF (UPF0227 family)
MILYIHGFGSSAFGIKADILKKRYGKGVFIPTLSHIPNLAIDTLSQTVESFGVDKVIGSSLGGFYALYLSKKYGTKSVLINPAITPHITLRQAIPQGINYYDNSRYDFREEYLQELEKMSVGDYSRDKILLLLQKGDEVLPWRESREALPDVEAIIEDGGDHGFQNFESKLLLIEKFFS